MFIFITTDKSRQSHIYEANEDGSELVCATSQFSLYQSHSLALSPDHNRYFFRAQSRIDAPPHLFLAQVGDPGLRILKHDPNPSRVIWLSNTRVLCYAPRDPRVAASRETVWVTSTEGQEENFSVNLGDYIVIDALIDRHTLLLTKGLRNKSGDLYPVIGGGVYLGELHKNGNVEITEVVDPEEFSKSHEILRPCSWTPNGSSITCMGGYEDEVWIVDMDGTNPQMLVSGDYYWMEFKWSPNGKKIAFMRGLDGGGPGATRGGMYITDIASGNEYEVLVRSRDDGPWGWSSDSQRIVQLKNLEGKAVLAFTRISDGVAETLVPLDTDLPNPTEFTTI